MALYGIVPVRNKTFPSMYLVLHGVSCAIATAFYRMLINGKHRTASFPPSHNGDTSGITGTISSGISAFSRRRTRNIVNPTAIVPI